VFTERSPQSARSASDNRFVGDYPQSLVPLASPVVRFTGPKAAGRLVVGVWRESLHALNCSSMAN